MDMKVGRKGRAKNPSTNEHHAVHGRRGSDRTGLNKVYVSIGQAGADC